LTHEVENSGDGRASQQSEVQTVTFNAGRGLGGTATLTYHDLYGQSWTTRPFAVGGDQKYRLEIAVVPTTSITSDTQTLTFTYGSGNTATFNFHGASSYAAADTATAGVLRNSIASLFETQSRGTSIHVTKHYSSTPAKLGGSIHQSARVIYDITIPVSMAGHDDNGGLTALTVAKHATAGDNEFSVALYQMGDNSDAIANALTSLPNSVIPGVTVTKVSVTDSGTNSAGSSGNSYAQSYAITFNSEANAGDQNMLSCNAGPCDEDGCLNRGPGVSEVRYMRHDPENHGEGINFVSQGYFIMDIGADASAATLSAGSIKIMWDTGSGISSAIFAVVATASEVQTALRTITGWEGVTVELWGSREIGTSAAAHILKAHQFKVTFAAGYDDMGKSPTFYTMTPSDGAYADAGGVCFDTSHTTESACTGASSTWTPVRARLYDQRFSNSIWLGKTTGYFEVRVAANEATAAAKFTPVGGTQIALNIQPQSGDSYYFAAAHFGTGGTGSAQGKVSADGGSAGAATHGVAGDAATDTITTTVPVQSDATALRFAYLVSSATSRQTSDYFAVGSTVEVLATTWDDGSCNDGTTTSQALCTGTYDDDNDGDTAAVARVWTGATQTTVTGYSNNLYRKFRVTGHVTNQFNTEFAKLDAFPAAEANSQPVETGAADAAKIQLDDLPDYNLKITNNNGTVRSYENIEPVVTVSEVQVLVLETGLDGTQTGASSIWKLSYKGEMSQDMDHLSTPAQVAEEINGFSALSGPVTVVGEGTAASGGYPKYVITFDAADGDVAELGTHTDGTDVVTIVTRANGWSIEAPIGAHLDTMQAGGTINVTAREECKFTVSGATGTPAFYFCYDGVCGSTTVALAEPEAALASIKDDNGVAILSLHATADATYGSNVFTIQLPMGKSCDGLEMRAKTIAAGGTITKEVDKHNNGKVFKITRAFVQIEEAAAGAVTGTAATAFTFSNGKGHSALAKVSTVVITEKSGQVCAAHSGDFGFPIYRTISAFGTAHGGAAAVGTIAAINTDNCDANAACAANTKCDYSLRRYVITLDSMPTASVTSATYTATKTLLYKSPVGSCNVAETTKGTFESYECSNRGACDGKSGLCACYEGYSGESCQTQTVLV